MNPQTKIPKLDTSRLTPAQQDKLETWQQAQDQLTALQDIADMTQEMLNVLDNDQKQDGQSSKEMGAVLLDIRDKLDALNNKETAETPEFAKPISDLGSRLEKAFSLAVKQLDLKPNVSVDSPSVSVNAPSVDLSGVEKIIKTEWPKALQDAIKLIPQPEKDDYGPLLDAWAGISEQLVSIETATRMKPQPGSMTISNLGDLTDILAPLTTSRYDYSDSSVIYVGSAPLGTSETGLGWTITKFDLTDSSDALGVVATGSRWSGREVADYV